MFQIERLWVRSLAPITSAKTGRGRGKGKGGRKANEKEKAGHIAVSRRGSLSKPSSPTSSSSAPTASPPDSYSHFTEPPTAAAPGATGVGDYGRGVDGVGYDSRSVLSPTLLYDDENPCTTSVCTSCKQDFVPEENAWNSCR